MPGKRYIFLTIDDVEQSIAGLVSDFFRDYPDPMPTYQYLDGDRGRGKMESALAQPRHSFGGQYLYRTVFDKAAALWRSITLNHPYIDGNKRMGLVCCHIFLALNGYALVALQDERVDMSLAIARNQPEADLEAVARWLRRNTIKLSDVARLLRAIDNDSQHFSLVMSATSDLATTSQ